MTKSDKNKSPLTERQLKAIPNLVASPTYGAGCKKAKISRNTLYQWLKNLDFREELKRQRDLVIQEALEVLKGNVTLAVDALIELLSTTESETIKRLICNDIINYTLKSKELENLELRICELENAVKEYLNEKRYKAF